MGFPSQLVMETTYLANLGAVPLTHEEVREGILLEQTASRQAKAISSRVWRSRSLIPGRLLLYSYIPPQVQAPPMEKVSAPGPEGAKEIIKCW